MKKTMFITSVIMVVVMAIALTTSSLAWFSAAGATAVSTNSFQVTALSETVEGLAISNNGAAGTWSNAITLSSENNKNQGLKPLVPFTKESHYESNNSTWDFEEADLLTALLGGTENQGEDNEATYTAYMIGNKLGNNNLFSGSAYREGWYEDTFYITNTANGATAKAVNLNCTIDFYCPDGTTPYVAISDTVQEGRDAYLYSLDATLNVAVLYAKNRFDADGSAAYNDDDTWELLAFGTSKGANYVNLGREGDNFETGENANSSYHGWTYTANLANSQRYTVDNLANAIRPDRDYQGNPVGRDVMTIRVIAWYDGPSLINNNAANANLKFGLTFGKKASTYANS